MTRSLRPIVAIEVIVLSTASGGFAGVASFQGLGDLSGGSFDSRANAISADGSVVVGVSTSATGVEAFRWTTGGGMFGLGYLPGGGNDSFAHATSADGSVVVGRSVSVSGPEAFLWTADGGMVALSGDAPIVGANGVSADGSVVVGDSESASGSEAFRWTEASGMIGLGDLSGGIFRSAAAATSADGSVIVGSGTPNNSTFEAFRWTAGGGMVGLGDLPGGQFNSLANATSADGSVVVGFSDSALGQEAFRWTTESGMVGLGELPGVIDFGSRAFAVSADGSVVVGGSSFGSPNPKAFLWTSGEGMRSLQDILTIDLGLDLTGWNLDTAYGISSDGLTVVGYGTNPAGSAEGWIATLPEPTTLSVLGLCVPLLLRRRTH